MKRDVMLPKFNLPGQTSWLMKGLWIAGGVVLLQVVIVAALLLRDRTQPTAVAVPAAQASPAPVAPAAAPPAPVEAAPPARAAERTGAPASDPPRATRPGRIGKAGFTTKAKFDRRGKLRRPGANRMFTRNALGPGKLTPAKGGRRPAVRNAGNPPRAKNARPVNKTDEIDRLLRNFK
jgi:hypothetical protein